MTAAILGALIVWAIVSPSAALLLGRVIRHRNTQTPTPGVLGEAAPGRRAHLWLVR